MAEIMIRNINSMFVKYPKEVLMMILLHVGTMGWHDCWCSDDNLASKKLYPDYQFSSKSKRWIGRLRTNADSMRLVIKRFCTTQESMPKCMMRKPTAPEVDSLSERGAVVWATGQELMDRIPIKLEVVETKWYNKWADGSEHIDTEITAAILEKRDDFDVLKDIGTFRELIDLHHTNAPVAMEPSAAHALEVDAYNLMKKQIEYDIKVFQVWEKKCKGVSNSRTHAALEYKLNQQQKCKNMAQDIIKAVINVLTWEERVENQIGEVMTIKKGWAEKTGANRGSDIPAMVWWQMAAPCLVATEHMDKQTALLTWAISDNMQSIGLVQTPVFTYQKGQLHVEESKMIKLLTKGNHNIDHSYSLLFKDKHDSRDHRPLVYPGRMVFASPVGDPRKTLFGTSSLMDQRRTEAVPQLASKDMREKEDLHPASLPPSTDSRDSHIKGATKHAQMGVPANEAVLHGVFTGSPGHLENLTSCGLLDLFPHAGEMLEAFINVRGMFKTVLFYVAFAEDEVEKTWLLKLAEDTIISKLKDGSMKHPGADDLKKEMPTDLLEAYPPLPTLNQLVIKGEDDEKKLFMPVALVKQWCNSKNFGKDFTKFVDTFTTDFGILDDEAPVPSPNKKRPAEEVPADTKRSKTAHSHIVEANPYIYIYIWL